MSMSKRCRGFLLLFALLVLAGCAKTPEQQVRAVIEDMISLVEAGKTKKLILTYAPPEFVERLRKSGGVDAVAARLKKQSYKLRRMRKQLAEALKTRAEVSQDGKRVSFRISTRRKPLVFKLIDGRWYLF